MLLKEVALSKNWWMHVLCCPPKELSPRCPECELLDEATFSFCLPFPASLPKCLTGLSWHQFSKKQLTLTLARVISKLVAFQSLNQDLLSKDEH